MHCEFYSTRLRAPMSDPSVPRDATGDRIRALQAPFHVTCRHRARPETRWFSPLHAWSCRDCRAEALRHVISWLITRWMKIRLKPDPTYELPTTAAHGLPPTAHSPFDLQVTVVRSFSSRSWCSSTGDGAPDMRSTACAVLGNAITSRIELSPERIATMRSSPSAMPP